MIYSYRRVSTDEQHNGPQAQADAIQQWLMAQPMATDPNNSNPICCKDFFDNGVSGSVPLYQRTAGGQMGAALKSGDIVVVAKLDRLFRSVADAAVTLAEWTKTGIKLVAIAEGFDMTNPYGKAMAQMASVFAELEREMIRSRTKAALSAKKARGECVGEVPYGWWKDGVGTLIWDDAEQSVITRIVNMHKNELLDAAQIANNLNNLYIRAKKGGKWSKTQVQRVIDRARET